MSKILQQLIFLISILNIFSADPKFMEREETFKPFVSVPSLSTLQKIVNNVQVDEMDQASFSLQGSLTEPKQVKCLYLDKYSVYDISSLGANTLQDNDEVASTHDLIYQDKKYTIFFNFCYNLKHTDKCKIDDSQAYYMVDNKCEALSGDIKDGNEWKTYTKKNDKNETVVDYLEIKVNKLENKPYSLTYRLYCDDSMEKKKFKVTDDSGITKNGEGFDVLLVIESKEACVKVDFYFIFKFIEDYKVLFVILLMAFGLFNCIFGQKFAKYTAFLLCVFIITILVLVFSQYVLPSGCAEWIIWVMLALGIILGCTAGYFTFKYHEKVLALLTGGVSGFFIGQFLYNLFGNQIPANGIVINIVFVIVSIGVMIAIAFFFKKFIVIFATSFIGSYCFIRGISLFAGGFPDEITVMDLRGEGETEQLKELLTWRVYVYLAAIVVATVLAIIAQYRLNRDKNDDDDDSDRKDKNLVKSSE
jgi:hypothetical protein